MRPWVEALRNVGFAVFAKPKVTDDNDVDDDMLAHIELRQRGRAAHVVVASGTAARSGSRCEDLVAQGHVVTVIGFRGYALALASDMIDSSTSRTSRRVPRATAADDPRHTARAGPGCHPSARCVGCLTPRGCIVTRPTAAVVCRATRACSVLRDGAVDVADGGSRGRTSRRRPPHRGPVRELTACCCPGWSTPTATPRCYCCAGWAATCR